MSAPLPDQTLDITTGTGLDFVRARYDEAWQMSLTGGGPPPEQESFLAMAGDQREALSVVLNTIDSAYSRLREMIREGAVTVTRVPVGPPPPQASPAGGSHYADTL